MDKNRTLIEVTAKAICKADGYDPEGTKFSSGSSAENVSLDWEFYISQATAALNAVYEVLKEPSEEMVQAAIKAKIIGECDISDYIQISARDAVDLGVVLSENFAGDPRFHPYSDIAIDEHNDAYAKILTPIFQALLSASALQEGE